MKNLLIIVEKMDTKKLDKPFGRAYFCLVKKS